MADARTGIVPFLGDSDKLLSHSSVPARHRHASVCCFPSLEMTGRAVLGLVLVLAVLLCAPVHALLGDEPFVEYSSDRLLFTGSSVLNPSWQTLPITGPALGLYSIGSATFGACTVLTADGLYAVFESKTGSYSVVPIHDKIGLPLQPGLVVRRFSTEAGILFANATHVGACIEGSPCRVLAGPLDFGAVYDLGACPNGIIWLATESGLWHQLSADSDPQRVPDVPDPVQTAACFADPQPAFVAVAPLRTWRSDGPAGWRYEWNQGTFDGAPTALQFDRNGTLWMGGSLTLVRQTRPLLALQRIGGRQGLPLANHTALGIDERGAVWLASAAGAVLRLEAAPLGTGVADPMTAGLWRVFRGGRWLPDAGAFSPVDLVAPAYGNDGAWAANANGLARLRAGQTTLLAKAQVYQAQMSPWFDRHGLVGDIALNSYGSLLNYTSSPNDNNGLWTSLYLGALCFQYAVTGDEAVRAEAWRRFEAMELLYNVTGVPGLMARSYVTPGEPGASGPAWHDSVSLPGYQWKGDTSSDEVVGHMFVHPLVADLVARTEAERARARRLVTDTVRYITENGYYLIDVTGQPTTWGRWAPELLNLAASFRQQRGLNSIQMLAMLLSAHSYSSGDSYFLSHFDSLRGAFNYAANMINAKEESPADLNFSDDELGFLALFTYAYAAAKLRPADPARYALPELHAAAQRWYDTRDVAGEHNALWIACLAAVVGAPSVDPARIAAALWTLQRWPREPVQWPYRNSDRFDVRPAVDRPALDAGQLAAILPPDERGAGRVNGNPYNADDGDGRSAVDPGAWLLPFWMGRYYGLW